MTYYYSASTNSFYPAGLKSRYENAGTWPDDVVEIDDETYQEFGAGQALELHRRAADKNGQPTWEPIPPDSSMPRYFDPQAGEIVDNPDYVPPAYNINKNTMWRRATDEEAEIIDTAIRSSTVRRRRLWDDSKELNSNDEQFAYLHSQMAGAFGEARADEILAPED